MANSRSCGIELPDSARYWVPFMEFGTSNVIYFLYWMLSEGMYGQSIGKMIMRIKNNPIRRKGSLHGSSGDRKRWKGLLVPDRRHNGLVSSPVTETEVVQPPL